jgi:hypothetical protein
MAMSQHVYAKPLNETIKLLIKAITVDALVYLTLPAISKDYPI